MATVSKKIADRIKANNGYYAHDPRVMRIVEYDGMGGVAYGIEYERELGKYAESHWVRNPRIYFEAD